MTPMTTDMQRLHQALSAADPSVRLRAAMQAGTSPDLVSTEILVERFGAEPDFFVRDMLTWALIRRPQEETLPVLLPQLHSENPRMRSQVLHTLSKIGESSTAAAITRELLHDADNEVARTAWRTAAGLVDADQAPGLAEELLTELGRRDHESRRSLSRALVALGEVSRPLLERTVTDEEAAVHARATLALLDDPDADFTGSMEQARRIHNGGYHLPAEA
ncbi:HEAT repeat domain-containing protein [Corynebacterium hylobatis]